MLPPFATESQSTSRDAKAGVCAIECIKHSGMAFKSCGVIPPSRVNQSIHQPWDHSKSSVFHPISGDVPSGKLPEEITMFNGKIRYIFTNYVKLSEGTLFHHPTLIPGDYFRIFQASFPEPASPNLSGDPAGKLCTCKCVGKTSPLSRSNTDLSFTW